MSNITVLEEVKIKMLNYIWNFTCSWIPFCSLQCSWNAEELIYLISGNSILRRVLSGNVFEES